MLTEIKKLTELKLQLTDKPGWYLLLEDLHFTTRLVDIHIALPYAKRLSEMSGIGLEEEFTITVPRGFLTDLASVPTLLDEILPPDGPWAAAAVVHDFLYQTNPIGGEVAPEELTPSLIIQQQLNRFEADRIFYLAMLASDVGTRTATVFFNGVRMGGSAFFRKEGTAPNLKANHIFQLAVPYNYIHRGVYRGVGVIKDHCTTIDGKYVSVQYPNCLRPFYVDLI